MGSRKLNSFDVLHPQIKDTTSMTDCNLSDTSSLVGASTDSFPIDNKFDIGSSDDDQTDFTDESTISTPQADIDMAFFDPLSKGNDTDEQITFEASGSLSDACTNGDSQENENSLTVTKITKVPSYPQLSPPFFDQMGNSSRSASSSPSRSSTLTKISSLISLDVRDRGEYIYEAAKQITFAQESESNGNFVNAFHFYKSGVEILLRGVQEDDDDTRVQVVRRKTARYLKRAEEIHTRYVSESITKDSEKQKPDIQFDDNTSCQMDRSVSFLKGDIDELHKFRVLRVLYRSVMLVIDNNTTYIIKVLRKSACSSNMKTIAPTHCPFMVQLYKFYETDSAIFLLLQHASGGRLWKYVSDIFQNRNYGPNENSVSTPDASQVPFNFGFHDSISSVDKFYSLMHSSLIDEDSTYVPESKVEGRSPPNSTQEVIESSKELINSVDTYLKNDKTDIDNCNDNYQREDEDSPCEDSIYDLYKAEDKFDEVFDTHSDKKDNQTSTIRRNSGNDCSKSKRTRHLSAVFAELDLADEKGFESRKKLPEGCIRQWAAELVVALSTLHSYGVICKDLRPSNILLGNRGHILLTYFGQWNCVDQPINNYARQNLYTAPEVGRIYEPNASCDWWSLGVLLFELITGNSLAFCHPAGFTSHSDLTFPDDASLQAKSLVKQLICFDPRERLDEEEIKQHPFFLSVDWTSLER
ncbi:DgyrCDS9860 [Dimorphilus gyrociliatus]|nr:DgyrCDS9860 [Dimorphilus gyrociliatus]